jgi:hypothetical protein
MTRSLHSVLEDLKPRRIFVLHPGLETYDLNKKVEVSPLTALGSIRKQLGI